MAQSLWLPFMPFTAQCQESDCNTCLRSEYVMSWALPKRTMDVLCDSAQSITLCKLRYEHALLCEQQLRWRTQNGGANSLCPSAGGGGNHYFRGPPLLRAIQVLRHFEEESAVRFAPRSGKSTCCLSPTMAFSEYVSRQLVTPSQFWNAQGRTG